MRRPSDKKDEGARFGRTGAASLSRKKGRSFARGQSIAELAIFGAILLFVVGLIVRTAVSGSQGINLRLRAARLAFSESYRTAAGFYSKGKPSMARNSANILIVEDRLIPSSDKFGSRDRQPMAVSVGAGISHTAYMNLEWGEYYNLPVIDIIVNGKRFPLTTAGFKEVRLSPESLPACSCLTSGHGGACWESECYIDEFGETQGCAIFYKKVPNDEAQEDWCPTCAYRFDLDLDCTIDVPPAERARFMWQWVPVVAIKDRLTRDGCERLLLDETDGIRGISKGGKKDPPVNMIVEVDQDLKEERILKLKENDVGQIVSIKVLDFQEGDIDLTQNSYDIRVRGEPRMGLANDVSVRTIINEATRLETHESPLSDVSVQWTQQEDVIFRHIVLKNNTGRFCSGSRPTRWPKPEWGLGRMTNPVEACGQCGCCGKPPGWRPGTPHRCLKPDGTWINNCKKTCMELGRYPIIHVRTPLDQPRGHIWETPRDEPTP